MPNPPDVSFWTVGTTARYVSADTDNVKKVHKNSGGSTYWKTSSDVSSADTELVVGTPVTISVGTWFISTTSASIMEEQLGVSVKASDVITADDITVGDKLLVTGEAEIDGALNHDGTTAGFFNVTPVTRPTAYTQTYATADKTHANATSADLATTATTTTTPFGFATQAQGDNIATQFNALRADVLDAKQLINSVIDDLQALGLLQ